MQWFIIVCYWSIVIVIGIFALAEVGLIIKGIIKKFSNPKSKFTISFLIIALFVLMFALMPTYKKALSAKLMEDQIKDCIFSLSSVDVDNLEKNSQICFEEISRGNLYREKVRKVSKELLKN